MDYAIQISSAPLVHLALGTKIWTGAPAMVVMVLDGGNSSVTSRTGRIRQLEVRHFHALNVDVLVTLMTVINVRSSNLTGWVS